jgi:hypothetical protein
MWRLDSALENSVLFITSDSVPIENRNSFIKASEVHHMPCKEGSGT